MVCIQIRSKSLSRLAHRFLVVLHHHDVRSRILQGLDLVLLVLDIVLELLQARVQPRELVDPLLVVQQDVDLLILLKIGKVVFQLFNVHYSSKANKY
jgi:hypothetical protein